MNKRILVSETEKSEILRMHESFKQRRLIKEDEGQFCTDTLGNLIKKVKEYYPKEGLVVEKIKGNVKNIKVGQNISEGDTISMTNGSEITFKNIDGYGISFVNCNNNQLSFSVVWN